MIPAIFGLAGESISAAERALFTACDPAGYILFGRNIRDAQQLRALTDDLRTMAGREDLFIMIDQEGGRVARMKPPHWPIFPAAAQFDALYERGPSSAIEAARSNGRALASVLHEAGITVNAAPVLDVRQEGASAIVGDRSFGAEPMRGGGARPRDARRAARGRRRRHRQAYARPWSRPCGQP